MSNLKNKYLNKAKFNLIRFNEQIGELIYEKNENLIIYEIREMMKIFVKRIFFLKKDRFTLKKYNSKQY